MAEVRKKLPDAWFPEKRSHSQEDVVMVQAPLSEFIEPSVILEEGGEYS